MALITGNNYTEIINGTSGNDTIDGKGGDDFIDGGGGTDTVVFFANRNDFNVINLSGAVRITGLSSLMGSTPSYLPSPYRDATVKLLNVENVQFSDTTISLTPPSGNLILKNNYAETINGTSGNDIIDGNGGSDFIDGGNGADTAVFFANRNDFNVINLSGAVRITGLSSLMGSTPSYLPSPYRDATVKLLNVENVQFSDTTITLTPPSGNLILKNNYAETINGTGRDDTIDGNGGSDFIDGGNGIDTAVFFANSSDFTVTNLGGVVRVTGLSSAPSWPSPYSYATVELLNVEKLQFIDKTVIIDSKPLVDDYSSAVNTMGTIAVGGTVTGDIETANDTDWFKVTLEEGHHYKFDLEGSATSLGTLVDPFIRLRDNTGIPVPSTFDDDSGVGLNASFAFSASTTGVYYLSAGSGADDGTGTGTYKMSIAEVLPSTNFGFPLGNLDAQGRRTATEAKDGDGFYVTTYFGDFEDPTDSPNDFHLGEDWTFEAKDDLGAPVYPVADGVVVYAGYGGTSWGNVVIIKHTLSSGEYGGYVTSMYGHLGNLSVSKGDSVSKNNPIGVIGPAEGISTGPHLHLEIRTGDNPNALVPGAGYSASPKPPGWLDPTEFINDHSLSIIDTRSSADRLFNWAESIHSDLFPHHSISLEILGYYARQYENGMALGEKNNYIYFYDGNTITLVGTINDFLSDAITAGF